MDFFELLEIGTPQEIQAAINKGADAKARDKDGRTALMFAAAYNQDPEVIATLLKAGADLEARETKSGWTALMAAAATTRTPRWSRLS